MLERAGRTALMPNGFGIIDYVGFASCLAFAGWALLTDPRRLLLGIPFILTCYFIVPFVTLLTPAQIVPLILLGWMVAFGPLNDVRRHHPVVALIAVLVIASLTGAILIGDAGLRPILRSMHYATLMGVFLFGLWACRTPHGLWLAMWGLAICAGIHAAYSIYQLVAFQTGLPFRAIVRGISGNYNLAVSDGLLRVNGLASEPKRAAYVLFAGALAALYLASNLRGLVRTGLRGGAVVSFILSTVTLSGSFFASIIISLGSMFVLSTRLWKFLPVGALGLGLTSLVFPDIVASFTNVLQSQLGDRVEEVSAGLGADRIYRQEFFAEELVKDDPTTLLFGLGLGRYNQVLSDAYGYGAGLARDGSLLPLNSQIFEVGFDLGLLGLIVLYVGSLSVILRLRGRQKLSFYLQFIVLVVICQSLFVQSLYLGCFLLGMSVSFINSNASNDPKRSQSNAMHLPRRADPRCNTRSVREL